MNSRVILEAKEIIKTFPGTPPTEVLRGASLTALENETIAIMGGSGEGKSTLLHILGTLDTPTSGSLLICGKQSSDYSQAALRNEHIGFIFQSYHLLEDFSALENVLMPLKIGRKLSPTTEKRGRSLMKELGLQGKEDLSAKLLSGGEKQRLAIARALSNDPHLLLADEPTGNLDRHHSQEIQRLLLSKAKELGKALIVVTHDEEFAKQCDRILFLKEGALYNQPL
ncbi:MAG: Lipoprotein-releasing system ATP-binding protein LolD [Chlamydiae bacterium]|nr:Lipoprotein-releasing system ATP-binding protein LolD [Chlamydiota bacterium]